MWGALWARRKLVRDSVLAGIKTLAFVNVILVLTAIVTTIQIRKFDGTGLTHVLELIQPSFATRVHSLKLTSVGVACLAILGLVGELLRYKRRRASTLYAVGMLIMAMSCFAIAFSGFQVNQVISAWQEDGYSTGFVEGDVRLAFDRSYCIAKNQKTCLSMPASEAAPLYFARDPDAKKALFKHKTISRMCRSYSSDFAVCASCKAVESVHVSEKHAGVMRWVDAVGKPTKPKTWCGLYFSQLNSYSFATMGPYVGSRTRMLRAIKKAANTATGFSLFMAIIALYSILRIARGRRREETPEANYSPLPQDEKA